MTSLTAEEALLWNDTTSQRWRSLLEEHPEALTMPCDIREGTLVRDLLQHIVGAELRYAERLMGDPVTDYAAIPKTNVTELFDMHDFAMAKYRTLVEDESYDWAREVEMETRSQGTLVALRRSVLFHALMHSVRHYAQLATLLRQKGIPAEFPMDYFLVSARAAEPPASF